MNKLGEPLLIPKVDGDQVSRHLTFVIDNS